MCIRDREWGNLDDRLTRMEEQEEGIFGEINKHSGMTNDKGKVVEVIGVENKTCLLYTSRCV